MRLLVAVLLASLALLPACTLVGPQVPLTPTPDLPSIVFQYPANNAQVFINTDLNIELVARDNTSGISRIELYLGPLAEGEPLQTVTPVDAASVPVFTVTVNWLARPVGNTSLTAVAYRADGVQSDEATILLEVIPREDAPNPDATATPTLQPTPQ